MHQEPGAKQIVVTGAFDDLRSQQVRFLEEAARIGEVTVLLWADDLIRQVEGKEPGFPQAERVYFLQAIRFVRRVLLVPKSAGHSPKTNLDLECVLLAAREGGVEPDLLVLSPAQDTAVSRAICQTGVIACQVLRREALRGFPQGRPVPPVADSGRKKVVVTGCYDWVHSGHVRFFEEASAYGDLYVIVGHDANLRLLKGPSHPFFPQAERRYVVGSIRYVTQALISTGEGWLDADPEIRRLKPDIYAVNEDGDKGGKREYCAKLGIEYLVLHRTPAPGLPPRTSTELRGY